MIICVVGKTSSGKDSVAKIAKDLFNLDMVVSYTTRPKRKYETDGVEHYFISKERMKEIKENDTMIAYTINEQTGIEYCATVEAMSSDTMIYIINPNGIEYMKENNIDFVSIYVDCSNDKILQRGSLRGDSLMVLTERLSSEIDEFNKYRDSKCYDYIIDNNGTYEELKSQTINIFNKILNI